MNEPQPLDLIDRLASKLGDWRTWAALWIAMITYYSWKHSATFVDMLKAAVENRAVLARIKQLEDENRVLENNLREYAEQMGALRAEVADLRKRNEGLAQAFIKARHRMLSNVPPTPD